MSGRRPKTESPVHQQHITETHPNPHGEQDTAEVSLRTDHSDATDENAGQNTSTRGNRMNPSVTGPLEDPTTDSMFNLADPQTREIEDIEKHNTPPREKARRKGKIA